MRKTALFISIIALFFTNCKGAEDSSAKSGLKLVWEENFDIDNHIDDATWSKIPRGKADWNNFMTDYDSCYSVNNGVLTLYGIKNTMLKEDTASYLTGGIFTKGKRSFTHGRIEIKAKVNSVQGAWPAIWLLPEGAKWPIGGEIDIMEHLNFDTIAYQTIHTNYTYNLGIKEPNNGGIGAINRDDYNIYAIEKHQDSLCFFINDNHTFSYPRIDSEEAEQKGQFPFNSPFYLLIDMQLGGSWVGKIEPEQLPATMEIDWVRLYEFE